MRRRPATPALLATALATVVATLVLGAAPSAAGTPATTTADTTDTDPVLVDARTALGLDERTRGRGPGQPVDDEREATLALRDLQVALPRLGTQQRGEAESLLARPTDGAADPAAQGYRSRSKKICGTTVCVHYVSKGADAPDDRAWVRRTLKAVQQAWAFETRTLGYRAPVSDGVLPKRKNGGNAKFDVYLKELSKQRLYGYCSPEYTVKGNNRLAMGYCVLDDDFAKAEYGGRPLDALRVTAAHELFHAIQYNYDYREDRWLMESTASWVEERFADEVDDNRQYLRVSQVRAPGRPLDRYDKLTGNHYGNWAWWEHLTQRHGASIVKKVWTQAGEFRGAGRRYSTKALGAVLASKGGFPRAYARFVTANLDTRSSYAEGKHWPTPKRTARFTLDKDAPRKARRVTVDHMAAQHVDVTPAAQLKGTQWRVRLELHGPAAASSPLAAVTVQTASGAWTQRVIGFNRRGRATTSVPFSSSRVDTVTVSFINASTTFDCGKRRPYSCSGKPRHDDKPFKVVAKAFRP